MNIQHLILFSLGPTMLSGCPSTWNCKSESSDFTIEEQDILASDVVRLLLDKNLDNSSALTCEDFCMQATYGVESVDDCSFELDNDYPYTADTAEPSSDNTVVGKVTCSGISGSEPCEGRRPLGYVEAKINGEDLGSYFAKVANLEGASVIAFEQLVDQLRRWDAPMTLIERAKQAADDEIRHARIFNGLAKSHGASLSPIQVEECQYKLLSVAIHNAVEGCVMETWAVLEAILKAKHTKNKSLQAIYFQVACDELLHAQLAWDLHSWFLSQLTPAESQKVLLAQHQACEILQKNAPLFLASLPPELRFHNKVNVDKILSRFLQQIAA